VCDAEFLSMGIAIFWSPRVLATYTPTAFLICQYQWRRHLVNAYEVNGRYGVYCR